MKKIVFIYIALVIVVVILAAWRLGAFSFLLGGGGDNAEVKIGNETVQVEVPEGDEERAKGLGDRESLEEGRGMLFVFEEKALHTFWMLDMNFPIDIVYIDDNKIVDMDTNVQPPQGENPNRAALPLYRPDVPINYVLEVPAGYAEKSEWKVGDEVEISGL